MSIATESAVISALPRRILELTVNNHPGVMSHVCGLFARRAYNVEGILCMPIDDGASSRIMILEVLLPMARPGIITAAIFSFVLAWQEYIFALLYTTTPKAQTAPVIMFYYLGQHQIDYGRLMAAAVIVSLPVAIPFAFIQRYYRQGLTEGGIKG